jgi:hypothetical protein
MSILFQSVGMKVRAHQQMSLFKLGHEPRGTVGKHTLAFLESGFALLEDVDQLPADRRILLPSLPAEQKHMLGG